MASEDARRPPSGYLDGRTGLNGRRARPFPSELMWYQYMANHCGVVRNGRQCKNPAGYQTSHPGFGCCRFHGGRAMTQELAATKMEAMIRARQISDEKEMDPLEAMLWCVRLSAGAVDYYRDLLIEIPNLIDYEASPAGSSEWYKDAADRLDNLLAGLAKEYGQERDRLLKTAEACVKIGLAERQVSLAERQGDLVAEILMKVIDALGLPLETQRKARQIAASELLAIPVTSREATPADA